MRPKSVSRRRERIAADVDAMIVIGGRHSSNTQKLFEICKEGMQEYLLYTDT